MDNEWLDTQDFAFGTCAMWVSPLGRGRPGVAFARITEAELVALHTFAGLDTDRLDDMSGMAIERHGVNGMLWFCRRGKWPEASHSPTGLDAAEQSILEHLVKAWKAFATLPAQRPDDIREFRDGISRLQDLLATRICRRLYPDGWGSDGDGHNIWTPTI